MPPTAPIARSAQIDIAIARIAQRQHGIVSRTQLLAAGISDRSIRVRLARGLLRTIHPGVYVVGSSDPTPASRQFAALCAVGPDAAISHLTAAREWRISRFPSGSIDVVSPSVHACDLREVTFRRTRHLPSSHVVRRDGIRRTTPARTIVDLADALTPWQLANVFHEARFRRLFTQKQITHVSTRLRNRRTASILREAMQMHLAGSAGTKSTAEDHFLRFLIRQGFPVPLVNVHVAVGGGSYELDFHWPQLLLNVEVDGWGHGQPHRQQSDAQRDEIMTSAGWLTLRVDPTYAEQFPDVVLRELRAAFAACGHALEA